MNLKIDIPTREMMNKPNENGTVYGNLMYDSIDNEKKYMVMNDFPGTLSVELDKVIGIIREIEDGSADVEFFVKGENIICTAIGIEECKKDWCLVPNSVGEVRDGTVESLDVISFTLTTKERSSFEWSKEDV